MVVFSQCVVDFFHCFFIALDTVDCVKNKGKENCHEDSRKDQDYAS